MIYQSFIDLLLTDESEFYRRFKDYLCFGGVLLARKKLKDDFLFLKAISKEENGEIYIKIHLASEDDIYAEYYHINQFEDAWHTFQNTYTE